MNNVRTLSLSATPPVGTTSLTTRWRPPHFRTSSNGSSPKAPSDLHVRTPLPSHRCLKLGPATYHIKIKTLGFVPALRFLLSQILCRLYKSPSDETINRGTPCVYTCKTKPHTHVEDPVVRIRVRWIMETPKWPGHWAYTKSVRVFRRLRLDIYGRRRSRVSK